MGLTEDIAALRKTQEATDDVLTTVAGRLAKSEETSLALVDLVGKLAERFASDAKTSKDEPADAATAVKKLGEALDQLDALDGAVAAIAKSVKTLAQGDTSQTGQGDQIQKTGDPDRDFALALLG